MNEVTYAQLEGLRRGLREAIGRLCEQVADKGEDDWLEVRLEQILERDMSEYKSFLLANGQATAAPQPKPRPKMSSVGAINGPQPLTWDDYEQGCLGTFRGGHEGPEAEAFCHGMQTVFNLLRAEFPPAEEIQRQKELSGG